MEHVNLRYWLDETQSKAVNEHHASSAGWRDHPVARSFAEEIEARLQPGMSIAEIGCAGGYWYERLDLERRGIRYSGFDISPFSVEQARSRYPKASFFVADLFTVRGLESFDYIISRQVLFFLDRFGVERIFRQVRDGALITLQEPFRAQVRETVERAIGKNDAAVAHIHHYPKIARETGLSVLTERPITFKKPGREKMSTKILITCRR